MEDPAKVKARYEAAVNSLVEKFKNSTDVAAVILLGSLSYDTVWEKSDIEITLAVKDGKSFNRNFCLDADGININVDIIPLSKYRRELEGEAGGSIEHSFNAKGTLLYTTDEALREFFENFKTIGANDMAATMFLMCGEAISLMEKTHKWIEVRRDFTYAQLYVLKMAEAAARLEVVLHREPPTREVVLRALELNPELFEKIYKVPLSRQLDEAELNECCRAVDEYLKGMLDVLSQPLLEVMPVGELMTISEIAKILRSDSHYLVHTLDYFAQNGVLMRVSREIKLLPRGGKVFDEVAFININY